MVEEEFEGEACRGCACVVGYITLLPAHAAEGQWNVAQSLLSPVIDGVEEMVFFPRAQ